MGSGGFEPSKAEPTDLQATNPAYLYYKYIYILYQKLSIIIFFYLLFSNTLSNTLTAFSSNPLCCQKLADMVYSK
jgi:hypothetical protein